MVTVLGATPFILGIDSIDRITIALAIAGAIMLLGAVLYIRRLYGL